MHSMTGYGAGSAATELFEITVEVTGVNHKSRDVRMGLSAELQTLEAEMLTFVNREIQRGSINVSAVFQPMSTNSIGRRRIRIDTQIIDDVCSQLEPVLEKRQSRVFDIGSCFSLPGVVSVVESDIKRDELAKCALDALTVAMRAFKKEREREGGELRTDLCERYLRLCDYRDGIARKTENAARNLRARFRARITALGLDIDADDDRVAREVALLVQKADISEELVRLDVHLREFGALLNDQSGESVGRKLQFLCQELHREINTLGAKTSETAISSLSLEFKAELDRVREQICNIE